MAFSFPYFLISCRACALEYLLCRNRVVFVNMAAAREKRIPKRYSDEIFSTGLLFRKKTRTINDRNRLYPVVVTAVNKVEKWVKIHYVGYSEQFDEWRAQRFWGWQPFSAVGTSFCPVFNFIGRSYGKI